MASRPVVGVTIGNSRDAGRYSLNASYVRSVEMAGGLPVVLAPGRPDDAAEHLARVDALILSGGADVDPRIYGEEPHTTVKGLRPERDAFELALCRQALARHLPILAICRGQQVLNVAQGGTLVQDIPSEWAGAGEHDPRVARWATAHDVALQPGTRLLAILGSERIAVNSFHHQAVKGLGEGLVVSARADDGVIEGVELQGEAFVVGVQWHPEDFWDRPRSFQPLFDALMAAVGSATSSR